MQQDPRTREILVTYNQKVQSVARKAYLSAQALAKEIEESKINQEDMITIKLNVIGILSKNSPA